MPNVIEFAKKALHSGEHRSIVWTGYGGGVGKTISCAEILKRDFTLYQVTRICHKTYFDTIKCFNNKTRCKMKFSFLHLQKWRVLGSNHWWSWANCREKEYTVRSCFDVIRWYWPKYSWVVWHWPTFWLHWTFGCKISTLKLNQNSNKLWNWINCFVSDINIQRIRQHFGWKWIKISRIHQIDASRMGISSKDTNQTIMILQADEFNQNRKNLNENPKATLIKWMLTKLFNYS